MSKSIETSRYVATRPSLRRTGIQFDIHQERADAPPTCLFGQGGRFERGMWPTRQLFGRSDRRGRHYDETQNIFSTVVR